LPGCTLSKGGGFQLYTLNQARSSLSDEKGPIGYQADGPSNPCQGWWWWKHWTSYKLWL